MFGTAIGASYCFTGTSDTRDTAAMHQQQTNALVIDSIALLLFILLAVLGNQGSLPKAVGRSFTVLASLQGVTYLISSLITRCDRLGGSCW